MNTFLRFVAAMTAGAAAAAHADQTPEADVASPTENVFKADTVLPSAIDLVRPGSEKPKHQPAPPTKSPLQVTLNKPSGVYDDGDFLSVRVRVPVTAHLYVIYHQADGDAVLVYPNTDRRNTRFAGKQTHTLPSPNDEVQCVVRGPFQQEVVQVLASTTAIEEFENAVKDSGEAVPVMRSTDVDAVCQAHAAEHGLASELRPVSCPNGSSGAPTVNRPGAGSKPAEADAPRFLDAND